jgi:Ca2+-binding EF-hand superfamily protein
MFRFSAS